MNSAAPSLRGAAPGFSLIELIGVLAIMAILASVIVPNALHSIDQAAETAEAQTVANLGQGVISYLHDHGVVPTPDNWSAPLAGFANLSPASVATNSRGQARVYLVDPASSPAPRVLILSNLRAGLDLPLFTDITTAAAFQTIWQTADGAIPDPSSWPGWAAWSGVAGSGNFLVISRVNLSSQWVTLMLNNLSGVPPAVPATASYSIVAPDGTVQGSGDLLAGSAPVSLLNQIPGTQLNLFSSAGGVGLSYSYVVSTTAKTFDFNGVNWVPQ